MARSKPFKVDYDALFKAFIAHSFKDFLAFAIAELYQLVDWNYEPEFLEQELLNAMRGRYKQRGKQNQALIMKSS
jgi:hypothetical protein